MFAAPPRSSTLLLLALLFFSALSCGQEPGQDPASSGGEQTLYTESFLEIHVSGYPVSQTALVLQDASKHTLLRSVDLAKWRIKIPSGTKIVQIRNSGWVALEQMAGLSYRLDAGTQSLWLEVEAQLFDATRIDYAPMAHIAPQLADPGGFLNYDISLQKSEQVSAGLYLDGGLFGAGWTARSQFGKPYADSSLIRLESALTLDDPAQARRITLFDSTSVGGLWGRPVRLAGIGWASNYGLQPYRITHPTPLVMGQTSFPSSVDILVNNATVFSGTVQPGPFSITDFPIVGGQGDVTLHIRDVMGRERNITQSFYGIPQLLKPGLHDYSYSAGFERINFGLESNRYGRGLLAANHRYGFNEKLSAELHGEASAGQSGIGLGAVVNLFNLAAAEAALAASRDSAGSGQLLALGVERRSPTLTWAIRTQVASAQFSQLGVPTSAIPLSQSALHLGFSGTLLAGLGLTFIRSDDRNQLSHKIFTAGYSANLSRDFTWSASAYRVLGDNGSYGANISLNYAFAQRSSIGTALNRDKQGAAIALQVQKNALDDYELGYRIAASSGENGFLQGMLNTQNEYGAYVAELSSTQQAQSARFSASGGMALTGGDLLFGRNVGDSFAVVEIADFPGVRVYANHRPVARTDAAGLALVSNLQPYQLNQLSVELANLPLDAHIAKSDTDLVPYYASGYRIRLPITRARAALLDLVTADGQAVAAGSTVLLAETGESFPVGLKGLAYLSGLQASNQLQVRMPDGKQCGLIVPFARTAEVLPHLGKFMCAENKP